MLYRNIKLKMKKQFESQLTVRLTPESGRSSDAAMTNSFPYFVANKFFTCNKSGTSEHLGEAKIMLAIASLSSIGHSLSDEKIYYKFAPTLELIIETQKKLSNLRMSLGSSQRTGNSPCRYTNIEKGSKAGKLYIFFSESRNNVYPHEAFLYHLQSSKEKVLEQKIEMFNHHSG